MLCPISRLVDNLIFCCKNLTREKSYLINLFLQVFDSKKPSDAPEEKTQKKPRKDDDEQESSESDEE